MTYSDVEDAFLFVSGGYLAGHTALVCRSTGQVCFASEDAELDEIPEEAYESPDWVAVPQLRDIGCGTNLVDEFVAERLPEDAAEVQRIFRRAGAYGRYKALLAQRGVLEEWYQFEGARQEEAIRAWCRDNGLDLTG